MLCSAPRVVESVMVLHFSFDAGLELGLIGPGLLDEVYSRTV